MITRPKYGLRWSSHARVEAENVTTGQGGDVTSEPFTAPPPDPKKCTIPVAANFAVSFSINAARGGSLLMQTAARSEETSGHPWLVKKEPPKDDLGGKR